MKTYFSIAFFFFLIVTQIFAQEAPKVRFEKVSEEEMKMTVYAQDTTAEAVILFDNGSSEVKYDLQHGFMLTYAVSYTHLRAHETRHDLVCRLLLEKKK